MWSRILLMIAVLLKQAHARGDHIGQQQHPATVVSALQVQKKPVIADGANVVSADSLPIFKGHELHLPLNHWVIFPLDIFLQFSVCIPY